VCQLECTKKLTRRAEVETRRLTYVVYRAVFMMRELSVRRVLVVKDDGPTVMAFDLRKCKRDDQK
jgi:hypothetical protein